MELSSQKGKLLLCSRVNIRKAAGPDGICGHTLRHCADQLSEVFTVLFQMCAGSGYLPQLWKTSTIIPVPKINHPRDFNDFRPVALTSLVMKNFEKILKGNVVSLIDGRLDPPLISSLLIKLVKVLMTQNFLF